MRGKAILIAGYPGSGKSTYGRKLRSEVNAAEFVDDYHRDSIENKLQFEYGRCYESMCRGLEKGETWMASDIMWCLEPNRLAVEAALRQQVPGVAIEWHYLDIDASVCRERVKVRGWKRVQFELAKIEDLSKACKIPSDAKVIRT